MWHTCCGFSFLTFDELFYLLWHFSDTCEVFLDYSARSLSNRHRKPEVFNFHYHRIHSNFFGKGGNAQLQTRQPHLVCELPTHSFIDRSLMNWYLPEDCNQLLQWRWEGGTYQSRKATQAGNTKSWWSWSIWNSHLFKKRRLGTPEPLSQWQQIISHCFLTQKHLAWANWNNFTCYPLPEVNSKLIWAFFSSCSFHGSELHAAYWNVWFSLCAWIYMATKSSVSTALQGCLLKNNPSDAEGSQPCSCQRHNPAVGDLHQF